MEKVYTIINNEIKEVKILGKYNNKLIVMDIDLYRSRPWGEPPYWKIDSQLNKHNYHCLIEEDEISYNYENALEIKYKKKLKEFKNNFYNIIYEMQENLDEFQYQINDLKTLLEE